MRLAVLFVAVLAGCPTSTDTGDSLVPTAEDRDGDGVLNEDDCEPDDGTIAPGLTDGCDGIDNNCNGEVDENADAITVFRDQDGDGYGDPATTEAACAVRAGWTLDNTDCGPTDPKIFPGAAEYCDGKDHDCDGLTMEAGSLDMVYWWTDADSDGFGAGEAVLACEAAPGQVGNAEDCDDTRADVSPRAPEVCDPLNVDEDCDLLADDLDDWVAGGTEWYPDLDRDGYGALVSPVWTCDAPQDYVDVTEDCDDGDPLAHPGATEVCDGKDDDCDGTVDQDAVDAATWYSDRDADGYGDEATTVVACDAPADYSALGHDCNDRNENVHPGADESVDCDSSIDLNCDGYTGPEDHDGDGFAACEECDDGDAAVLPGGIELCNDKDDDCDGRIDIDAVDGTVWYADADSDGYGDPLSTENACDQPPGFVSDATDCDDTARSTYPGASESCATLGDDNCDGITNELDAIACTEWYDDVDGDGVGGPSVCACDAYEEYTLSVGDDCDDGDTTIYPGANDVCGDSIDQDCDGFDDGCTLADGDGILIGRDDGGAFGSSILGLGDVDGDGVNDLAVGGIDQDGATLPTTGAALVVLGPTTGSTTVNRPYAFLYGEGTGDNAGAALSGPVDTDRDGVPELLVAAPDNDGAGRNAGRVYLVEATSGLADLSTSALFTVSGAWAYDELGASVLLGTDLDDNGRKEAVIGAPGNDDRGAESGAVYIFAMPASGAVGAGTAAWTIRGDVHDRLAVLPPVAADVTGDGVDDLVIGGWGIAGDALQSGGVALFEGPLGGDLEIAAADAVLRGEATDDEAGYALDLRDVDGDGTPDLLTGAPGSDGGAAGGGAAYLVLGPLTSSVSLSASDSVVYGESAGDAFGTSVVSVGISGSPVSVLFGAPGRDDGGAESGAVYRFNGLSAGTVRLSDADAFYAGEAPDTAVGSALGNLGDTDGDGHDDAGLGAPGYIDSSGLLVGAVYVL